MASFELRRLFHNAMFGNRLGEFFHDLMPNLGMGHLASAEADRHLELVALLKELGRLLDLGVQVADIDVQRKADLFDFDHLLVFLGFFFPFGLFKAVLAVIHDPANRRSGLRGNFHQIEILLDRKPLCLTGIHDAELASVRRDHPNLLVPDILVDEQFLHANVKAPPYLTKNGRRILPSTPNINPVRPALRPAQTLLTMCAHARTGENESVLLCCTDIV